MPKWHALGWHILISFSTLSKDSWTAGTTAGAGGVWSTETVVMWTTSLPGWRS